MAGPECAEFSSRWTRRQYRIKKVQTAKGSSVAIALCLVSLALPANAQSGPSPTEVVQDLFRSLRTFEEDGKPSSQKVGFQLPEKVVNLYLAASQLTHPRPIIDQMQVHLLGGNRCIVDAKVDFDGLNGDAPDSSKSALKEFHGVKSVRAEFHFSVQNNAIVFDAKPIKSELTPSQGQLTEIIRLVAASQPEKIDSTRPIPLPFGLRRLWTANGMLLGDTQ